ncbi:hypothetical protein QP938_05545 [Porticoccaceae bacterium LTM1]|nr:hypothetical protein QP938_05545 [Porticoccaceae bacterium LTM1]
MGSKWDYAINIVGAILARGCFFLVNVALSFLLSVGEYSEYGYFIGWINALSAIVFLVVDVLQKMDLSSHGYFVKNKVFLMFLCLTASLLVGSVGLVFLSSEYGFREKVLFCFGVFSISMLQVLATNYSINNKIVRFNVVQSVFMGLYLFSALFVFYLGGGVFSYVLIYLVSVFFCGLCLLFGDGFFEGGFSILGGFKAFVFGALTSHIIPLLIQSLMGLPLLMVIQYFIKNTEGGDVAISLIFLGSQLVNAINIFSSKYLQVLLPKVILTVNSEGGGAVNGCFWGYLKTMALVLLVVMVLILSGLECVDFWAKEYKSFFLLIVTFSIFNVIYWWYSDVVNAFGGARYVLASSLIWGTLVLLIFLLIWETQWMSLYLGYFLALYLSRIPCSLFLKSRIGNVV